MDVETNKNPFLDQKDNREDEVEHMSSFAFLLSTLAFGVLYVLDSAKLGRTGNNTSLEHPTNGVLKILLMFGCGLIALVMWTNDGRMTQLSQKLMLIIALGIVFLSLVIIFLLYIWGMRCLGTAKFIFTIGALLFIGLAVLATLAAWGLL